MNEGCGPVVGYVDYVGEVSGSKPYEWEFFFYFYYTPQRKY